MGKFRTIESFFKKNEDSNSENSTLLGSNVETLTSNERPSKSSRIVHYYFTFHIHTHTHKYIYKKKIYIYIYTHGPPKYKFLAPPLVVGPVNSV